MKHILTYKTVPRETFSLVDSYLQNNKTAFDSYLQQLMWWNKKVNLVSRNVSRETVWQHIRHSLLLTEFKEYKEAGHIVDTGTGGGLPGLPLAIASSEKQFLLNDIVTKKILAVRQMVQKLNLANVTTADRSVQDLSPPSPFLLVSKHAFKINDLLSMTQHMSWTEMVFYKGMDFKEELKAISSPLTVTAWDLFEESHDPFYKNKAIVFIKKTSAPPS